MNLKITIYFLTKIYKNIKIQNCKGKKERLKVNLLINLVQIGNTIMEKTWKNVNEM